jgi:integrase
MEDIAVLLRAANAAVAVARAQVRDEPDRRVGWQQLFVAEQNRLLVRMAADTGARRGELATLRLSDLDWRVLTIERNLSMEILGPTKSKRTRRMTIGATTAAMIHEHFDSWAARAGDEVIDDWVFAPNHRRAIHARASLLSHRFVRFRARAGVPDAALHRFRHSVATTLVGDGHLLKAQARLGHRDAATTLRHYAHATPLDDLDIADELDRRLNDASS